MKRLTLLIGSAVTCGAVTGFLIGLFPESLPSSANTHTLRPMVKWSRVVEAVRPAPETTIGKVWQATSSLIERAHTGNPRGTGLKLRESVVIVNGADAGASLAPGTAVAFVSNEGRYLRVQHQQRVLTIPRSAVERLN